MASFELPSNTPVMDGAETNRQWMQWFDRIHAIASATEQSGPTGSRPTKRLWIGRMYFDTTLGYPVWVKSVGPVVWVNASGTTV